MKVPLEQYFTSDYRELIRDARGNVLDAFTQLPPHLAQTGMLVDLAGNAYPEEVQPMKVGAGVGVKRHAIVFDRTTVMSSRWRMNHSGGASL